MDPTESAEYDVFETSDHGWTKVENRKQKQKQKQLAKIAAVNESKVARYKNLKAEEIKPKKQEKMLKVSVPEAAKNIFSESEKPKQVSLPEAAAKQDAAYLADSPAPSSETSEVPKGSIESAEYNGVETSDHGWTKVENRKQRQRQKQLVKNVLENESKAARYKNLKAEEEGVRLVRFRHHHSFDELREDRTKIRLEGG